MLRLLLSVLGIALLAITVLLISAPHVPGVSRFLQRLGVMVKPVISPYSPPTIEEEPFEAAICYPDGFDINIPKGHTVHGIDVSKYQYRIQWKEVVDMQHDGKRISFAFIKATEGWWIEDRHFRRNWQHSREAGMIRGAYHFFQPGVDPTAQARNFLQAVDLEPGDLPPVLDVEVTNGFSAKAIREQMREWLHMVEAETGTKPILYANRRFYLDYLHGHFDDYLLWVALYHRPSCTVCEDRQWTFWQHSDRGRVNGIDALVDFNVFSGTVDDLLALCMDSSATFAD